MDAKIRTKQTWRKFERGYDFHGTVVKGDRVPEGYTLVREWDVYQRPNGEFYSVTTFQPVSCYWASNTSLGEL